MSAKIKRAVKILQAGGIIAYPTEAVYGLGCDPFNEQAVHKILNLKHRSIDKGLIIIASSWQQVKHLVKPIDKKLLKKALATWPGPITWIFPAQTTVPVWIRGKYDSIAIRVSKHPIVQALCKEYDGAIVSTSANIEGKPPAKTSQEVLQQFPQGIDLIIDASVGKLDKPTEIRDVLTDKILR